MFSRLSLVALLLSLTGCTKPLEISSITDIRSKTGSKSLDVYEPKRQSGQQGLPDFAGDQLVEVRSYAKSSDGGEAEIVGASCTLSAADFNADFQTPARVRVPLYREQSSALAVSCEKSGFKKASVSLTAFDDTRNNRFASGATSGLIGLVVVSAIDVASDNTKNHWRYPVARVSLEP
jgi:hypothetical protein